MSEDPTWFGNCVWNYKTGSSKAMEASTALKTITSSVALKLALMLMLKILWSTTLSLMMIVQCVRICNTLILSKMESYLYIFIHQNLCVITPIIQR